MKPWYRLRTLPRALTPSASVLRCLSSGPALVQGSEHPPKLSAAIRNLTAAKTSGNFGAFTDQLTRLAKLSKTLPPWQVAKLAEDVLVLVEGLPFAVNDRLPVWIWALGLLRFDMSIPRHHQVLTKCLDIVIRQKPFTCKHLTTTLDGLLKTNTREDDLSTTHILALLQHITHRAYHLEPRGIAGVLRFLAKFTSWADLPPATQTALWSAFERNAPELVEQNAALCLQSLGQLGLQVSELNEDQQAMVLEIAKRSLNNDVTANKFACQHNTMIMLGLEKMGFKQDTLPNNTLQWMKDCVLDTSPRLNEQELSSALYSFGAMGVLWSSLGNALRVALQSTVKTKLPVMTFQQLFMTMYGLASMEASWDELPVATRAGLEQAVAGMVDQLVGSTDAHASKCAAISIYALGVMGAEWKSRIFTADFHSGVQKAYAALHQQFIPQDVANFIYGLGRMDAPLHGMSPAFIKALHDDILRCTYTSSNDDSFTAQQLFNLLQGLSKMSALWNHLPMDALEAALTQRAPELSRHGLASTLLSLGTMGAAWKNMQPCTLYALTEALKAHGPSMSSQEMANSMYGLALMSFDCQQLDDNQQAWSMLWEAIQTLTQRFSSFPRDGFIQCDTSQFSLFFELIATMPAGKQMIADVLGQKPIFSSETHVPSMLHMAVAEALPKALSALQAGSFRVANEFSGINGAFEVDIAVYHADRLIALVEVDGSFHYTVDGGLRRIDHFKEHLYACQFPTVPLLRIRNEDCRERLHEQCSILAQKIIQRM